MAGRTDHGELAAELIRRGHDPDRVRERLLISPDCWAALRRESNSLATSFTQWQRRQADLAEARLARAAAVDPRSALAYVRFLEQRRLNEARLRASEAKLGSGQDEVVRQLDEEMKRIIDRMAVEEVEVLGRVHDKFADNRPFDDEETEMAARMYRLTCSLPRTVAGGVS